ncbi:transcription factor GTE6 [Arachis ipaensis]|uniref:transcription factor GTE6 n=1 Tax=Arachis ipaensis TaxID=130454 RepID=UPI0007AFB502|nr:transcription factor GTE6 [Arachis ipaensis]
MDQTVGGGNGGGGVASSDVVADLDGFKRNVDEIVANVDKLEKQLIEVEQFYQSNSNNSIQGNNSKGGPVVKEKVREKHLIATKKPLLLDAARTESAATKRMQELMRQFATILRQITQHKWAWPFMEPVDVEGLGLHDYYEVIEKPMDFSTIKSKMEAKDGTGYKNVREIYADVRLIFKNAMKYNNEKHDVHVMAKTLLEYIYIYIYIYICRKLSTHEKKLLGTALTKLSPENLNRALEIVAENNPNFQSSAEEVDLDIDAQTDFTLWRLKIFVKDALDVQGKSTGGIAVNHNDYMDDKKNNKRRREICDSLAKTNSKRTKKISNL